MEQGGWLMNKKLESITAWYFDLRVEVLVKLRLCSLIRFQGREFVVDTVDLVFERHLQSAA
jgi:hypothetical protein